jgi:raffinose/stachyose/melibiose transport system permease protein
MTATLEAPTVPVAPEPQDRRPRRWGNFIAAVIAIVVALLVVLPLAYVVIGGFRTSGQISNKPVGLPNPWVWSNYSTILSSGAFWQEVWNSVFIAVVTTLLVVWLGSMAAFALSRYVFRGRESIYIFFTLGLLFPSAVAILPLYVLLRDINWLNTPWAVTFPQVAFGLPLTIVILRPFMRAVPGELEDAAIIDGCTRFAFYWRILMPLSRPALITVGILTFIGSWNAYLLPLLVFDDPSKYTLPLGTAQFQSDHSQDTALILAFTAVSMIPALCFFVLMERRIIGGLSGSIKG